MLRNNAKGKHSAKPQQNVRILSEISAERSEESKMHKNTEESESVELGNEMDEYEEELSEFCSLEQETDDDEEKFDIDAYFEQDSSDENDAMDDKTTDSEVFDDWQFFKGFTSGLPSISQIHLSESDEDTLYSLADEHSSEFQVSENSGEAQHSQEAGSSIDRSKQKQSELETAEDLSSENSTQSSITDSQLFELDKLPDYKEYKEEAAGTRLSFFDMHTLEYTYDEPFAKERMASIEHRRHRASPAPKAVEVKNELEQDIAEILAELFDNVVEMLETADFAHNLAVLNERLDKPKLIRYVRQGLNDLISEQKYLESLEQQIAKHFARRQNTYALSTETEEFSELYEQKYQKTLSELDRQLQREKVIQEKFMQHKVEAMRLYEEKTQEVAQMVLEFSNKFKQLVSPKRKCLNFFDEFDKSLQLIQDEMLQIATIRLQLIKRQHLLLTLQTKHEESHYIGNGKYLTDYQKLLSDVTMLELKLRDNIVQLNSLHRHYTDLIHFKAHTSNKIESIRKRLRGKEAILNGLINDQNITQIAFNQLIHKRADLHKKKTEIHRDDLPIHNTFLLLDYDKDFERCEKKRKEVRMLRQQLSTGQSRLKRYLGQSNFEDVSLMGSSSDSIQSTRAQKKAPSVPSHQSFLSNFNSSMSSTSVQKLNTKTSEPAPPKTLIHLRRTSAPVLEPKLKITSFSKVVKIFNTPSVKSKKR